MSNGEIWVSGRNDTDKSPMYEMPLFFVFGGWGFEIGRAFFVLGVDHLSGNLRYAMKRVRNLKSCCIKHAKIPVLSMKTLSAISSSTKMSGWQICHFMFH